MKCDVCDDKTATVFLTQIVKGNMQKNYLWSHLEWENVG